jgi:hypothetical protein
VDQDEAALTAFIEKSGGLTLKVLRDPGGAVASGAISPRAIPRLS